MMTVPRRTGSNVLGEDLLAAGVATVFGVMGEISIDMVATLTAGGARYVPARHEAAAIAMADGYARSSGRIGVATVTYGPGLTNALTTLIAAHRHAARVLVVTGQRARVNSQQGLDQEALLAPTGIAVVTVTAKDDIRAAVGRAFARIGATGRPVVLNFIDRIIETPFGADGETPSQVIAAGSRLAASPPDREDIARAIALIRASRRPLILAGRGAIQSGARAALEDLAEATGAVLLTTLMAKGLFGEHPSYLGLSGGFATEAGLACMHEADLVVAVGASLNAWTTLMGEGFPHARLVQVDSEARALGAGEITPDVAIRGDAALSAQALVEALGSQPRDGRESGPWWRREERVEDVARAFGPDGVDPREICRALDAILPRQRTLTTDAGHYFEFPISEIGVPDADAFLWTAGFGAVGGGLGTAIGAALGRPDRQSVLFIGDGGLMMSLGDLDSAVRCRARLLVVVMDDGAYGAEVKHLEHRGLPASLAQFTKIDFAALASILGLEAVTLNGPDDLATLSERLGGLDGPLLVHVRIDPSVTAHYVALLQRLVEREFGT